RRAVWSLHGLASDLQEFTMKMRSAVASLALTLLLAYPAQAQLSPASSGNAARQDHAFGLGSLLPSQSHVSHEAAMQRCEKLQGEAKGISNAEVEGQMTISAAHARLRQHDSLENQLKLAEARADAEFEVAKARCGDEVDAVRQACEDEATALRDLSKARARR